MKRLIVSGCSFTNYFPPTWPVFLSRSFDQTYNYAQSGAGNEYIFHSLIDADSELTFTSDDIVIVVWSGHYRLDHFHPGKTVTWKTQGEVAFRDDHKKIMEWYPDIALLQRSINFILATRRLLVSKGVNFLFSSIYDMKEAPLQSSLLEVYQDRFFYPDGLTKFYEKYPEVHEEGWKHPGPTAHHLFAERLAQEANIPFCGDSDVSFYRKYLGTEKNIYAANRAVVAHPQYYSAFRTVSNLHERIKPILYHPNTLDIYKKILMDVFPVNTT